MTPILAHLPERHSHQVKKVKGGWKGIWIGCSSRWILYIKYVMVDLGSVDPISLGKLWVSLNLVYYLFNYV